MTKKGGVTFQDLSLAKPVLKTLAEVGYEIPTPIQERTIPLILAGRGVLEQAKLRHSPCRCSHAWSLSAAKG